LATTVVMQVNTSVIPSYMRVRRVSRGRDRMVVEFTTIGAISAYYH